MCNVQKHNSPWTDEDPDPTKWIEIPADGFTEFSDYQCVGCGHIMTLSDVSVSDSAWIEKFNLNKSKQT